MMDHIGLTVSDAARVADFYAAALAPLGVSKQMEVTEEMTGGHGFHVGFGVSESPFFWIGTGKTANSGVHVAFAAADRAAIDAFYKAALAAGARDNGTPGLRAEYHPNCYAAFVLDADGNNIEAVCRTGAA